MTHHDFYILIIIGSSFFVLGIIGLLWGRKEERSWYKSIPNHVDIREFIDHSPVRPEPNALKIGGFICIALAIVIILISVSFFLWGKTPAA